VSGLSDCILSVNKQKKKLLFYWKTLFRFPQSLSNLSRYNVPEHYKITSQTVHGIDESCGLVFFKKEMAKPRKAITANRNNNEPKPFAGNNSQDDTNENEQGAREV